MPLDLIFSNTALAMIAVLAVCLAAAAVARWQDRPIKAHERKVP